MSSKLTLFIDDQYISPYTFSVLSALNEKKIPYILQETTFAKGESIDPLFMGKTYRDLIPAIEFEGKFYSESLAILEFIEEQFKGSCSLWPHLIEAKTQARMLLNWYRTGFNAIRNERSSETIFYPELRSSVPLSEEAQTELNEFVRALSDLLKPHQEFLFENRWTIADTETALMLQRVLNEQDLKNHPNLEKFKSYALGIWSRPSLEVFTKRKRLRFKSFYS